MNERRGGPDDGSRTHRRGGIPEPFHVARPGLDGGGSVAGVGAGGPEGAGEPRPRILLVSYHFPPGQSVGGLRWQQFSRFVRDRGWGLDVITLDPADVDDPDLSRLERLPEGTRVWGAREQALAVERLEVAVWRLYRRIRRIWIGGGGEERAGSSGRSVRTEELGWLPRSPRDLYRAYNAWRDHAHGRAWARQAAEVALAVHEPGLHRAVVTCGPPHMEHLAGRTVSRRTGLPWVMDMRDAWSCMPRLQPDTASLVWPALARHHERRCVRDADLVVANTDPAREALAEAHPGEAGKMITVMNGFDEDAPPEVPEEDGIFRLAFAGTLYLDRDPRPLFEAVARVAEELDLSPDRLRLELMGHVKRYEDRDVAEMAREAGVEAFVRLHDSRPRDEALRFLAGSELLLSLPQDLKVAIPSKIFEYMQFPGWILVAARADSAAERVLRHTRADVVEPGDVGALARAIAERYRAFAAGERPRPLAEDHPGLSRRAQADRLLDAMEGWMEDAGTPRVSIRYRGDGRSRGGSAPAQDPGLLPDRPGDPALVVTIDTEEDDWVPRPGPTTAENVRELPHLQEIFDAHGIRPTYLVTYQVASSPWAAEYFAELHRAGRAEVGCHLHPWNTPPLEEPFSRRNTLMKNLPPALQRAKLRSLIGHVRGATGVEVTSFRAGRWGISADGLSLLAEEGIRTDSSVLPYLEWPREREGRGFAQVPARPYLLDPREGLQRPSRRGSVVEVPPTVGFTRTPWERWAAVDRAARWRPLRPLHLPGILARTGIVERVALSPEISTAESMAELTRAALDQDLPILNLFFHSATLRPGTTPFVGTEAERDDFLYRVERYLEALADMTSFRSLTLDEVGAGFRHAGAPSGMRQELDEAGNATTDDAAAVGVGPPAPDRSRGGERGGGERAE